MDRWMSRAASGEAVQRAAFIGALVTLCAVISWQCVSHAERTAVLIVGVVVALAILRYPAFGLILMMATFLMSASPIYQQYGIFARSYTATDVIGLLVVVGFAAQRSRRVVQPTETAEESRGQRWTGWHTAVLLAAAAYFGWGTLALAWSPTSGGAAVQYIRHVAEDVAILGLALLVLNKPQQVRRGAGAYAITATALALYQIAIFHMLHGFGASAATAAGQLAYRGGGIGTYNENELAIMIALAPGFAYLATQALARPLQLLLTGLTIPPVGLALLILSSREAIIAVVAGGAVALMLTRDVRHRVGLIVLVALAAATYLGALEANLIPWYFQQRFAQASSSNLGHRLPGWNVGLQLFAQNPLTGLGTGGFQAYISSFHVDYALVNSPHSDYVGTLADNGLIGFTLLLIMLATLGKAMIFRAGRHPASIIIFSILAIDMASGSIIQQHWVWVAFGVACAFGLNVASRERTPVVPREQPLPVQPVAGTAARAGL